MICNYYPVHAAFVSTTEQQPTARANYILYEHPSTSLSTHTNASGDQQSMSDENLQKPKQKRTRTAFTGYQLIELEREFKRNMYMFRHHRIHVAQRLALRESQVKVWFQNRRMRHKKETKGLHEKKFNSNSAGSHSETNAHQEIVQRLMSYSQDPAAKHPKIAINYIDKNRSLKSANQKQILPQKQKTLTVASNTRTNEFSDIISFLEGNSVEQTPHITPPRTPHPNDLDIVLQSINNDLDVLPPALRTHQSTAIFFPSGNL